ncbi:MAG TPA: hypothetical protein VFR23_09765 [Jiangellaceae bacterium]|nr:hypothetical protein [Jiangellaceae bacterium]
MTMLVPRHSGGAADLAIFATRVARYEAEAVVRIVADGSLAGCFAETPFDALALRAVELAEPASVDLVVEAGTLAARAVGDRGELELPPPVPALRWTSSLPPRHGWTVLATLPAPDVAQRVQAGVEEFRHRAPAITEGLALREGRTALEKLADAIWDRELAAGVPLRLAHAADSYGFLGEGEVVLRSVGQWWRLDAPYGSVLARSGLALFAL